MRNFFPNNAYIHTKVLFLYRNEKINNALIRIKMLSMSIKIEFFMIVISIFMFEDIPLPYHIFLIEQFEK